MGLSFMLLIKNSSASPAEGTIRIDNERLNYYFFPWEEKEVPDEVALAVRDRNPKKFSITALPVMESSDVKDLKMQIRVLKRKLTLAEKEIAALKEQANEND